MIWGEIAHWQGLIPLVWLAILQSQGRKRDGGFWWIAVAFGLSWVADTVADLERANALVATYIFPISQVTLVGFVLLSTRTEKLVLAAGLTAAGAMAVGIEGIQGPDWFLYTVACSAVVWIVWPLWSNPLRRCLLVYFGLGGLWWGIHYHWLNVPTWYCYQLARLAGLLLFCLAASHATPQLRVHRQD